MTENYLLLLLQVIIQYIPCRDQPLKITKDKTTIVGGAGDNDQCSLEYASSVAGMFITTECVIVK